MRQLYAGIRHCLSLCLLLLFSVTTVFGQNRTIVGKVTDARDGKPVSGASIIARGTTTGTTTGTDGTFSLSVPQNTQSLTVSSIGFGTQDVTLGSSNTVNVALQFGTKSLDEVVVVGYGTQRKREVTSAVTSVKAEDFNQGGVRSPLDLIQGKVAGLTITRPQGNNPNSGAAIQLRGVTSLSGNLSPLIVIDGIPGGNLDLLQQDDIESFDVLKDGSAAAIYGTRANNGVILITTKKGRSGDPRFDYSTYIQREAVDKKPDFLTAAEFRALRPQDDLKANTDIYEMLIDRKNLSHYHNLAASGGTATTNYRASMYYNYAEGIAIENNRRQYGGRISINQRGLQGLLNMQVNLATNYNKANLLGGSTGDFEQAIQRNPTAPVFNPNGTYLETNAFNNYNPVARLAQQLSERDQQTSSADVKFTLEIIRGLRASAFGALVRNMWNDREYRDRLSRSSLQDFGGGGYARKANFLGIDRTFESTLDYNTILASDHSINALAGYSYQYSTSEDFNSFNSTGYLTDAFQDWNMGAVNLSGLQSGRIGMGSGKQDNTLIAFFGRVNYAFQQKYLAQFILRHEGSSRFGANNKWGNFPAVSLGWNLSRESFMNNVKFISDLKIRAGYGVTGHQAGIPNYQSLITLSTGGTYLQDNVWFQTYGPSRNPNPNLRWEKKKEFNVGVDFAMYSNRLTGSIDVYSRKTEDLLSTYTAQVPPFVNPSIFTNVGSISNKGVEVQVSAVPVRTKDFTWNTDVVWSQQRNKLVSISNEQFRANFLQFGGLPSPGNLGSAIRSVEGLPLGNFYGKRFAGFDANGKWLFYKHDGKQVPASQINDSDLVVIGNGVPKMMASWNSTVSYRNFDLTLFFRGKFGFDILNTKDMYFGNKAWLPNNLLRSAVTTHNQLNDAPQYSDYYLEKGDFVKLDNVTLGYNLKPGSRYVRNVRIYATARNLLTFTGYSGIDPELQDTGLTTGIDDRGFYPRTKSYAIGLNVGF